MLEPRQPKHTHLSAALTSTKAVSSGGGSCCHCCSISWHPDCSYSPWLETSALGTHCSPWASTALPRLCHGTVSTLIPSSPCHLSSFTLTLLP